MAAQGDRFTVAGLFLWRLRNGFSFVTPAARVVLRSRHVTRIVDEIVIALDAKNSAATPESVLSVMLVYLASLIVLIALATRSVVGACAVGLCVVVVAYVLAGSARDKRLEAIRESAPGALESMSACFGAGFTLLQTFKQVGEDVPGYLGLTFERSAHVLETGGSAEEALAILRKGVHASELAFIAVALDVQHLAGGSMKQVLDAARDSMKGELALRRSLRVQTAQAKLSARIVVVMPFILIAVFSLASPDFLTPFFSSVFGYALFALAVFMQAAGVVLVHRALSVDGVA
jgi:tight adherence protein B